MKSTWHSDILKEVKLGKVSEPLKVLPVTDETEKHPFLGLKAAPTMTKKRVQFKKLFCK